MSVPWVEAYRPKRFDEIVLDPLNRQVLQSIVDKQSFPHLLFHGPPGTGKTTTAVNLIRAFQLRECQKVVPDLVIHLNASDERGIDIIRNQIQAFVQAKQMFQYGTKFVILDEVDYMTKTAQMALRSLLQQHRDQKNVRFCLICNYVSKIDEGLQQEFVRLRFNQLPAEDIVVFLSQIVEQENLSLSGDALQEIQQRFRSDIRSMVNCMQSNPEGSMRRVMKEDVWASFLEKLGGGREQLERWCGLFKEICSRHNMDLISGMHQWLSFLLQRQRAIFLTASFLEKIEWVMHAPLPNPEYALRYVLVLVRKQLLSSSA